MPVLLSVSTRLILKMSCVDFGINQCAINCLTLLNSALVIGCCILCIKCGCVSGAILAGQFASILNYSFNFELLNFNFVMCLSIP